ncbi:ABC transporter substrate-binding protein [Ochrovirga pacifica]|uniref:ABC transporter substrate-binding protein n=1 Tax=Ochrovirga pacifica TaxID=1042376 RepID=UPI000255A509|nr:ABC transporter substrate-binding protein [Ochrovirga pacifica]
MKFIFYTLLLLICYACQPKKQHSSITQQSNLKYATGFSYQHFKKLTKVTVYKPFKNASYSFEYLIITGDTVVQPQHPNQFIIKQPVTKLIASSTTQIPVLEALNSQSLLKGYPNTAYISSKKTRALIDKGKVLDLGHEEDMNTELVLNLKPDVIFTFGVNHLSKQFSIFKKAGIPLVVDASWLEKNPLGRAEWIKFFALFLGKEKEASFIFDEIEKNYTTVLKTVSQTTHHPKVLYGDLFQDVWYAPAGESYMAKILRDAQMDYLWKGTKGTGSLSLSFERVFLEAKDAAIWLAPGIAKNKEQLIDMNVHYQQFSPYKNDQIYSYANATGATGGLLFFELGALRPDYILTDLVKIAHPKLLTDKKFTFFEKLP